jgi:hypothetical protein
MISIKAFVCGWLVGLGTMVLALYFSDAAKPVGDETTIKLPGIHKRQTRIIIAHAPNLPKRWAYEFHKRPEPGSGRLLWAVLSFKDEQEYKSAVECINATVDIVGEEGVERFRVKPLKED